jgi:putative SOS response-associated peptidase YedK
MCGRFTYSQDCQKTAQAFGLDEPPMSQLSYNIAPTQDVLAIVQHPERGWQYRRLRWGLIPQWSDDPAIGNRMINARCETVTDKPAFREAFKRRRCLVLADGFYEWEKRGSVKQPCYFTARGGVPFAFAGLWECNDKLQGGPVESCTVLATVASDDVKPIHARMPVLWDNRDDYSRWLDHDGATVADLLGMCEPGCLPSLNRWPVSTLVNSPCNDEPGCIERYEEE